MKMRSIKRSLSLLLAVSFFASFLFLPARAADGKAEPENIIIVADISRSIQDSSSEQDLKDGLKLAVDLAPNNTQISLIAVDSKVLLQTEFIDSSSMEQREKLKGDINALACTGSTNLALGLDAAVELAKKMKSTRIVLLADISEGGLTGGSNYGELTTLTASLTKEAQANNIAIDMILLGEVPENSDLGAEIISIPSSTGGTVRYISSSNEFAGAVEDLYFDNYLYSLHSITGINSTDKEQQVDISFPTSLVDRGRVYVSAHTPVRGLRATYATAELGAEINTSYAMLDLERPAQDGVSLYLDTGEVQSTKVYMIADYDPTLNIISHSELEVMNDKSGRQRTDLIFDLQDTKTGRSILSHDDLSKFSPFLELTSPSGEILPLQATTINDTSIDGQYKASFYPTELGAYTVGGRFDSGSFSIPVSETALNINGALPVKTPWVSPTVLSVIVALTLITGALIFYFRRKNRNVEAHKGAVELENTYGFTGKLQFATIIAEGGKREIRPFYFHLDQLRSNNRISLEEMYLAMGHGSFFPTMEKIWFTPGPSGSIVIKNNSKGAILKAGRTYGYRDKVQLFYDEKIYIVFEKDEDEVEVYYRKSRPAAHYGNTSKISVAL